MPSQIGIRTGPTFSPEVHVDMPKQGGSTPGRLQGRDVERLPSAQTVTSAQARPLASAQGRPSLQERQPVQEAPSQEGAPQFKLIRQARLSGMESAAAFTAKAGKPKDDISFSFLGKYRRDEGYKAVLEGMKTYEAKLPAASTAGPGALKDLGALAGMLDGLSAAMDRYQAKDSSEGGVRKDAFATLALQVANDKRAIGDLVSQLNQGASLPEEATLADALAFAREGVSLKDVGTLIGRGLSPSQAKEGREYIDSQRATAAWNNAEKRATYEAVHLDKGDMVLLEMAGHDVTVGAMYKDMRVAITHQTIVNGLVDEQVQGNMSKLGSGAFNSVFGADFATPDGLLNGAFKPLQKTENGWVASKTGIDRHNPQIVMRNLATGDVARKLGFNVVVKTRLGLCQPPPPKGQPAPADLRPQLGMVMARAQGTEACKTNYTHFFQPGVQREVTKLQLLDHLVGQGDRHGSNYFIHVADDGQVVVAGIDNDQCFGRLLTDPNGIRNKSGEKGFVNSYGKVDAKGVARPERNEYGVDSAGDNVLVKHGWREDGFRGTDMPPVIDTDMAAALRSLGQSPETLNKVLDGKLTPAEVSATHTRLTAMLAHVDQLESSGKVIAPSLWGTQDVTNLILGDRTNSYAARDFESSRASAYANGDLYT